MAIDRIGHAEHAFAAARDQEIADHRHFNQHGEIEDRRRRNDAIDVKIIAPHIVGARARQSHRRTAHSAVAERDAIVCVNHLRIERAEADPFAVEHFNKASQ